MHCGVYLFLKPTGENVFRDGKLCSSREPWVFVEGCRSSSVGAEVDDMYLCGGWGFMDRFAACGDDITEVRAVNVCFGSALLSVVKVELPR